jgi:drug/metabolite transporter (DMT)-like permease
MTARRNNITGVVFLCVGILVFSLQDSVIKAISGDHAVTLAIFLRAIVAFPILAAMTAYEGGIDTLETPQWPMLVLRGLILLTAYTTYFMAFPALPLAEAIALYFLVPLIVLLLSGPLLGEKPTPQVWIAVVIGLVGVGVILQPGVGVFKPAALLSLVSAVTYALAMVLGRKYASSASASVMTFYQNAAYLVGALTIATVISVLNIAPVGHPSIDFLIRDWAIPNARDAGLMGLCGIIAAIGATCLTQGYRKAEANIVAPFEYTGMIWAAVFGYFFFGEVPRLSTIAGMVLIAAAGFVALRGGLKK